MHINSLKGNCQCNKHIASDAEFAVRSVLLRPSCVTLFELILDKQQPKTVLPTNQKESNFSRSSKKKNSCKKINNNSTFTAGIALTVI